MRLRRSSRGAAAGFTLVEILLALLILAVGLLGVLALFPLGIDAARRSVESTRAATIARMARAHLFYRTGSGLNRKTPFERIVEAVEQHGATGPWFLPYDDEILDPDYDGGTNSVSDGPTVQVVVSPGEDEAFAEYAWSIAVARPASDVDGNGLADDYSLGLLQDNENLYVVQVTVYRRFNASVAAGDLNSGSMIVQNITPSGVLASVRSGDYVRYLDTSSDPWDGDGFWYQVDQVDEDGARVKLSEKYWGLPRTAGRLEFTDRVIGTYTFLVSAP